MELPFTMEETMVLHVDRKVWYLFENHGKTW